MGGKKNLIEKIDVTETKNLWEEGGENIFSILNWKTEFLFLSLVSIKVDGRGGG